MLGSIFAGVWILQSVDCYYQELMNEKSVASVFDIVVDGEGHHELCRTEGVLININS